MLPNDLPIYFAPAKLNLDLRILGRLPNGYHALESIFVLINLYDKLCFAPRDDGQLVLHTPTQGVEPKDDLTIKSAKLLQEHAQCFTKGVDIWLEKNIPMGGGLGGGSSDAATVLMVLNQLWNLDFSREKLMEIGLQLGADVPFFIFGETAFARGVGEQLQPIDVPKEYYVLVRPDVHVATPKIFAHADLPRNSPSNPQPTWENLQPLRNDMQNVVLKEYPEVKSAFEILAKHGNPRMTGSGSCLFLPCQTADEAQRIQAQLPPTLQSWCVEILARSPLLSPLLNK